MTQQEELNDMISDAIKKLSITGFSYLPKSGMDVYVNGKQVDNIGKAITTANTGEHPAPYESKKEQSDKVINKAKEVGDAINPSHYKLQTREYIISILDGMKELLLEKNMRYGDSAINPKRRFSKLDSVQGILIRLDDKMNRIENSGEVRVNDISDMIGYLVLLLVAKGVTKDDILKLID